MIAVLVAKAVPEHLRGYFGRFLTEVVPGVFAGRTSRVVAERLWKRASEVLVTGNMALVVTDNTLEQGYSFLTAGPNPPAVVDLDGLQLIAHLYRPSDSQDSVNLGENALSPG
ncbi:type I-E CRISPR-associated endoribonuclease Cas2 [Leucobacter viscericola]|uniref:Type I-E CRISPR-associated endoribonuclease Cas2 n=1 Tax=Leucobacter viscericola TaxID=2714935 RepID=A0A6G7XGV3_9MICO|nr:type I-E CRISPR-associated endoribonuclease Cas2e [Leucobacter viscericola]QIK63601.1 type I-E CRISPR-associated endoribonuclease Cas2 [Leucobacter viscericola]